MDTELKVTGFEYIDAQLKRLSAEYERKVVRRAARKAAVVLRDAARANFERKSIDDPQTPRNIARNIAVQESRRQGARIGGVVMRVGILGGARKGATGKAGLPGGDTWYWRFTEFGHRTRDGKTVAPRPFLRPVLHEKAQDAVDAFVEDATVSLDRLVP